ncbi:MAG: hypothetical protein AAGI38_01440 [Bacteroidota bacterium]
MKRMSKMAMGLMAITMWAMSFQEVSAQIEVRQEDHFWRKRVVRRLDLGEKINRPLVNHQSSIYNGGQYRENQGIVAALVNGLKNREYIAYHPDDWNQTMDYEALVTRMMEFERAMQVEEEEWPEKEDETSDFEEYGIGESAIDEWGSFEGQVKPLEEVVVHPDSYKKGGAEVYEYQIDWAQYEESFHIVEDWIFNRARSDMQQNIEFFEVIWTDPMEVLPEKVLARFRWEDVKGLLAEAQWKNRFNDAEARSLKEVMELRIFHSYVIDVGGVPVQSLSEAQRREFEMIEFEATLWSY